MTTGTHNPNALLAGRTALVTGAARGIGLATARLLIAHGARVMLTDLDAETLQRCASEFPTNTTGPPGTFAGDLTADGVCAELVAAAVEFGGGALDIVINNAGYNVNSRLETMSERDWQAMLDIHATVPFRILKAAGTQMISAAKVDRGAGREVFRKIVNVTSIALMGSAFQANYATAKAAVVGLTKSAAKEWGEYLINVNAVGFGSVDTRLTQAREESNVLRTQAGETRLGLSPRVMAAAVHDIPFGRIATPEDAAGAVFLLCTPWSDWITGQVLLATGGQTYGMSG